MNFAFTYHSYTHRLLQLIIILASIACLPLTTKADYYRDYIDRYSGIAISEMRAHGIPASITLAQGLLESAAGRSTLATKGNNHFGIKCHSTWTGDTLLRNDDAANECFRVYSSAAESFADHSRFLHGKRYRQLFDYDITDYTSWAHGLKRCGYATDPNYASRLITIIERYNLYLFDSAEGRNTEEIADMIHQVLRSSHKVKKSRGLHYVVAFPGDTYATIAKEFGLNVKKLLAFNDVKKDREIKAWEEVYLVEKLDVPPEGIKSATIGDDESIHSIAQRFGMRMETILELNPKAKDRPGTRLKLQ